MKTQALITTTALLLASGCAMRTLDTSFEPTGDDSFVFRSFASTLGYDPDDPVAEKKRLGFLETWLSENSMCVDGYEITDRKVVTQGTGPFGTGYKIIYRGQCT